MVQCKHCHSQADSLPVEFEGTPCVCVGSLCLALLPPTLPLMCNRDMHNRLTDSEIGWRCECEWLCVYFIPFLLAHTKKESTNPLRIWFSWKGTLLRFVIGASRYEHKIWSTHKCTYCMDWSPLAVHQPCLGCIPKLFRLCCLSLILNGDKSESGDKH